MTNVTSKSATNLTAINDKLANDSSLKCEKYERVAKLVGFNGKVYLECETVFKQNKKYYLSNYYWYGWYDQLKYDAGADEFTIKGENVALEEAYSYAVKTNLEANSEVK